MRLTSLASTSSLKDLDSKEQMSKFTEEKKSEDDNNIIETMIDSKIKGTIGPGGEKRLFDALVENEGVSKIRAALSGDELLAMPDENMPLRHFRAEKGNIENAIAKIKHTLAWRKSFEVDQIRTAFDANISESNENGMDYRSIVMKENETGKIYVRGYDKNGRAILILRPGKENSRLVGGFDELNQMRHLVYFVERAIACTKAKSHQEKFVVLVDYSGFSPFLHAPPMSTVKHSIAILQGHYPERMYKVYVVNPPLYFRGFWAVVKPFLDPVTREKMNVCSGKDGFEVFHRDFDLETMESCAYGTRELREYDSREFLLEVPFCKTFDEI